jgi:hypothetical protein
MDMSDTPITRHDGWTPARKVQFLEALAADGNVRAACARVGLSREAAYRLRRRDALFARAWAAAQLHGRERVGELLGTWAIEGIEEELWFRGELVGTRRRFDARLLLAHIARLDKLAEDKRTRADAARFDELMACVAGEAVPEALLSREGELPPDRATCARTMAEGASDAAEDEDCHEAYFWAEAEGEALWDGWFADACDAVDRLLGEPLSAPSAAAPRTLSTVSTSALAGALAAGEPKPDGD